MDRSDAAWNAALMQAVKDGAAELRHDDAGNPIGIRIPGDQGEVLARYVRRAEEAWNTGLVGHVAMHSRVNAPDVVLDPTLGSGTTAVVAQRLGRRFVGVDDSEASMRVSAERLRGLDARGPDVVVERPSVPSPEYPDDECPLCRASVAPGGVVPRHRAGGGDCVAGEKPRAWVIGQMESPFG